MLDNDLEKIPKLTPTLGVEYKNYKVLGLDATTWDMGGQSRYRMKYLTEFQKYFEGTSVLFYVIDFQAEDLYGDALDYLKKIITALKKFYSNGVFIPILFHKYDPHVYAKKEEVEQKSSALKERVEKVIGTIPHAYYMTSMYEPYSVFKAFSEGLLHQVTGGELIFQKIGTIATELGSPAAILLTMGGYIYGAWHSKDVQLMDLVKFSRTVLDFSHLISEKLKTAFNVLPLTEMLDIAAITFSNGSDLIAYCIMVPKAKDNTKLQEELSKKQEEMQKVLELIGKA
ncbi:MAG: hypothetical protein RBG13Loki_0086 [Promethearchaeota archaeon CR_4]|nr:MAG: hypothetical protein RBG13Loki_0086 [Candidatus Lokiarchaeota archaeon CR_4]